MYPQDKSTGITFDGKKNMHLRDLGYQSKSTSACAHVRLDGFPHYLHDFIYVLTRVT